MQAPNFEHTHFSIYAYPQQTVIKFNPAYSWLYPLFKEYITNIDLGNKVLPLIPECFDDERTIQLGKHTDISHFFPLGFFLSKTLLKDNDSWSQFCKFYEKNEGIAYDYVFAMPKENWNHFQVIDPYVFYLLIPGMDLGLLVPKALLPKLEGWQEMNRILASGSVSLGCKITVLWSLLNKKTDGLIQNLSKGTEFVKRLRENSIIAGLNHSRGIQQQAEKYCQSRAENYPGMTALTIQEKILEKLKLGPEALGPDDQVVKDVNITTNYLRAKQHDFFEHRGLNRAHALAYILNLPEGDEGNMSVACKLMIIHGVITLETSGGLRNSLHSFTSPGESNQLKDTADFYAKKLGLDANGLKALQQFILNKMLNTKIGDYSTWTEASLTAGFVRNTNITHIEEDDWKIMSIVPN